MKTVLIIPDVQLPFHDSLMLKKIVQVAKDMQPDLIFQGGDLIDLPTVSRWTKDTAAEYAPVLQDHITQTKDEFFTPLREAVPDAKFEWLAGNHDQRLWDYITKYAYPLRTLDALSMENLFELKKFDVSYVKGPHRIATNTYAIHGHESGGYCSSASAWDSKFTKRYGSHQNYVFFHTHQPFLVTRAYGYEGKVTPRFTMNVGSIMDPIHATYVKDGAVSWQMSFALLRDDGKRVWPELVTADNRSFWVSGVKY